MQADHQRVGLCWIVIVRKLDVALVVSRSFQQHERAGSGVPGLLRCRQLRQRLFEHVGVAHGVEISVVRRHPELLEAGLGRPLQVLRRQLRFTHQPVAAGEVVDAVAVLGVVVE